MNLLYSDAIDFVRARLDELSFTPSDMQLGVGEVDDRNLEKIVEKLLPEAIVSVHTDSPASLLEGSSISKSSTGVSSQVNNGVLLIDLSSFETDVLRMIYFKAADSNITVTEETAEDSYLGRLQLNQFLCGSPDCPVLVKLLDGAQRKPKYKYYTTRLTGEDMDFTYHFFPYPKYDITTGFFISSKLKGATLDYLTGLVLQAYEKNDQSEIYIKRAADLMK